MSKSVNIIVCCCLKNGIGKDGKLAWNLRKEMKNFAFITSFTENSDKKNAIIMGRKTWQSIPSKLRPLKNRINVVLSRDPLLAQQETKADYIFSDLQKSINYCKNLEHIEKIFIIGGEQIYKLAMELDLYDRIYLTRIFSNFDCDTFFPELNLTKLKKIQLKEIDNNIQEENGLKYEYQIFEKI